MSDIVRSYASIAEQRIDPLMVPFVLGIIENESGGKPGAVAFAPTKYGVDLPSSRGGTIRAIHALGLMQTIPLVIDDYNERFNTRVTFEQMTGKSFGDIVKQIEIGIWTLKNNLKIISNILNQPLIHNNRLNLNLLKLSLVAYAWGIGNLGNKLDVLKDLNLGLTFENLKRKFPDLGGPNNQPLVYVDRIFRKAAKYEGAIEPVTTGVSVIGALVIGGLVLWAARGSR